MGSYLDEWYGKDHVPVGFAINRGEYTLMTLSKLFDLVVFLDQTTATRTVTTR